MRVQPYFGTEEQLRECLAPYGTVLRIAIIYQEAFVTFESDDSARKLIWDSENDKVDLGRDSDPNSETFGTASKAVAQVGFRQRGALEVKVEPHLAQLLSSPDAPPLPLANQVTVFPVGEDAGVENVLNALHVIGNVLEPVQINREAREAYATYVYARYAKQPLTRIQGSSSTRTLRLL